MGAIAIDHELQLAGLSTAIMAITAVLRSWKALGCVRYQNPVHACHTDNLSFSQS
jgi:hypothetical protein